MNIETLCMGCMNELNTDIGEFCPKCGYRLKDTNPSRGLQPHTILNGKYLVGKEIGEGGFGITYIGFDLILNSRVAIKEYFPVELASRDTSTGVQTSLSVLTGSKEEQYKKGIERFVNEASNLAKFNNLPGIVSIRDFFYENNTAYMVMEYIDGITLTEFLNQNGGKLPFQAVLNMMKPVMDSLQKVHEAGIIHRDISPDNIMITKEGQVKLIDFGAARFVGNEDKKSLTVILKHGYAPEEQYQTNGNQGPWTDVYALATTLYRMITGIVPQESTERILSGDQVIPVDKIVSNVPKNISNAIMHGMGIKASERSKSVDVFSIELTNGSNQKKSVIVLSLLAMAVLVCVVAFIIGFFLRKNKDYNASEVELEETSDEMLFGEKYEMPKNSKDIKDNVDEVISEYESEEKEIPREELERRIEYISGHEIYDSLYEDFNGDGIRELFAMCTYVDSMRRWPYLPYRYYNETKTIELWYADAVYLKLIDLIGENETVSWTYKKENSELIVNLNLENFEAYDNEKKSKSYRFLMDGSIVFEKDSKGFDLNPVIVKELNEDITFKQVSEEELKEKIIIESGHDITLSYFDDFNGDGIKELLAYYTNSTPDTYYTGDYCIWFADSEQVVEIWNIKKYDVGQWIQGEPRLVQFGKVKQLAFTMIEGAHMEVPMVVGFDDSGIYYAELDHSIYQIDGIGYIKEYYDTPYAWSDFGGVTSCFYSCYYLNGHYSRYDASRISRDSLQKYKNWSEIEKKILEEFEKNIKIEDLANSGYLSEFKTKNLVNMSISNDDYIYLNYELWKDEVIKERVEEEFKNEEWDELLYGSNGDIGNIPLYCIVILKIIDDSKLQYITIESGYYDGGYGGANSPNLINLINSGDFIN